MLHVDTKLIKAWTTIFGEYLSGSAKPQKGEVRKYSISDIRVLAFVYSYWENYLEADTIKLDLERNSHYEDPLIDQLIISITPFFQELPNNIDEDRKGRAFGGELGLDNLIDTAIAYKQAGDRLVNIAISEGEHFKLFQPIMFIYRHAIELYIKSIIGAEINHDLNNLYIKLKEYLKLEFNAISPTWLDSLIEALHYSDPKGTAFRYGISIPKEELYTDLNHVYTLMSWTDRIFVKIIIMIDNKAKSK